MSTVSPRFIIDDLEEAITEKENWSFNFEFNPNLFKYNLCKNIYEIYKINSEWWTDQDENGNWNYRLDSLENGDSLFWTDTDPAGSATDRRITSFNVNLPNLKRGHQMFTYITEFKGSMPNLIDGSGLFSYKNYTYGIISKSGLTKESIIHIINDLKNNNLLPEGTVARLDLVFSDESYASDPDILQAIGVDSLPWTNGTGSNYDIEEYFTLTAAGGGTWQVYYNWQFATDEF